MNRAEITGIIAKISGTNTYKVTVEKQVRHPLYRKIVTRKVSYIAHSEKVHNIGDKVVILPLAHKISKTKHFVIIDNKVTKTKND